MFGSITAYFLILYFLPHFSRITLLIPAGKLLFVTVAPTQTPQKKRAMIVASLRPHPLPCLSYCFTQFAQELRNKVFPSFRQAGVRPHPLGCMDFVPTNCHINLMQVSFPKSTTSAGRTFSIRFGRKNSIFGLDPDQGRMNTH